MFSRSSQGICTAGSFHVKRFNPFLFPDFSNRTLMYVSCINDSSCDQKLFHLCSCFVLNRRQYMRIALQRERNAGVPQLIRNDFHRDSGRDSQRRCGVAQIVEAHRRTDRIPPLPATGGIPASHSLPERHSGSGHEDQLVRGATVPFSLRSLLLPRSRKAPSTKLWSFTTRRLRLRFVSSNAHPAPDT